MNPEMEQLIEASEVGRDVVASISASVLSSVISELVARFQNATAGRDGVDNVLVRYNEKFQLELHRERPRKAKDDEGFESDEDNCSTSSLCPDHLLKLRNKLAYDNEGDRASSFANSDSANSSGSSSDSDDVEISLPVTVQCWIERFPITDVLFCHTEPRFPNTIAWVIKRKSSPFDMTSRLGKSGVEHFSTSSNCLNVIVVKCQSYDEFSILCDRYRELRRRIKLDQYKSINRKKPIVLTCLTDTNNIKVSLSDIKVTPSNLLKASQLSIPSVKKEPNFNKNPISVSLTSLLKATLVSDDGNSNDALRKSNSLSNIAPKKFNLVQRTDFDGMTHSEVSKTNKSKIQKEIEGVILSQVDSIISTPVRRQRCTPSILPKSENFWPLGEVNPDKPPERPERRKFLRKKVQDVPAPEPAITSPVSSGSKSKSKFYLPIQDSSKQNNSFPQLDTTKRVSRKCDEYSQDRRRRARSAGRTVTTPMAYRYIDVNQYLSNTVTRRRRNSLDESIQVKLKPVIKNKKSSQDKFYNEPKKVTFSAYATVQVVD